jgi:nitrous oxidase accessory protein NosD
MNIQLSSGRLAAGFAFLFLSAAAPALAGTINVSSNGENTGTCGASDDPCLTIAQAVTNAVQGDTIAVGPGVYGGTAIVDKAVTIISSAGTGAAVINSTMSLNFQGIVLGKKGKGLSFNVGASTAVDINGDEIVVRGNRFSDSTVGIQVGVATDVVIRDNSFDAVNIGVSVVSGEATVIRGNQFGYSPTVAVDLGGLSTGAIVRENRTFGPSGSGFRIDGSDHLFFRNHVHGSPGGGFVTLGAPTNVVLQENVVISAGSPAYWLSNGSGWVLERNAALHTSAPGFYLVAGTTFVLTGNLAIGGNNIGFQINNGADHVLEDNSAIQNGSQGILLATVGTGVTVTGGNLYGNGAGNCGLENSSASAILTDGIYWGDPSGPGADPADLVCGNSGVVTLGTPADSPDKMKMPSIK